MNQATTAERFEEQTRQVAALADPVRRALYRYVVAQRDPVDREQAAAAVGVARHAAKFHLDRLEADGLLDTDYSRPPGRSGPGAGRPAKRYRRSDREIAISLPERRYDLAGQVLATAIDTATTVGEPIGAAVRAAATTEGHRFGEQARAAAAPARSTAACRRAVSQVLAEHGYEPRDDGHQVTLANCPFQRLAAQHPDLVCGMNLDLIRGLLQTCDRTGWQARLEPTTGRCCVVLSPNGAPSRTNARCSR